MFFMRFRDRETALAPPRSCDSFNPAYSTPRPRFGQGAGRGFSVQAQSQRFPPEPGMQCCAQTSQGESGPSLFVFSRPRLAAPNMSRRLFSPVLVSIETHIFPQVSCAHRADSPFLSRCLVLKQIKDAVVVSITADYTRAWERHGRPYFITVSLGHPFFSFLVLLHSASDHSSRKRGRYRSQVVVDVLVFSHTRTPRRRAVFRGFREFRCVRSFRASLLAHPGRETLPFRLSDVSPPVVRLAHPG